LFVVESGGLVNTSGPRWLVIRQYFSATA